MGIYVEKLPITVSNLWRIDSGIMLHHPPTATVMFRLKPTIHSVCQAGARAAERQRGERLISMKKHKEEKGLGNETSLQDDFNLDIFISF